MLLQVQFEYRGTLGLIVACIGFIVLVIGFVKGLQWFWQHIVKPLREWEASRKTATRERAFLRWRQEWLLDHHDLPIFILDDKKRCLWVNEALTDLLHIDSSEAEGRGWYALVRESDLSRVLNKWDEAYSHQSPYVNVTELRVGREMKMFIVRADPFLWKGRVANYIGTLEPTPPVFRKKKGDL